MIRTLLIAVACIVGTTPAFAQNTAAPSVEDQIAEAVYQSQAMFTKMLLDPEATAEDFFHMGDYYKSQGQLPEAANAYLISLRIDPKFSRSEYQLACTFVYWEKKELALAALQRAADKGFWGWRLMTDDNDLIPIRNEAAFGKIAQQVKKAYDVEAPKHAGQFTIKTPTEPPPAQGYPVILLMHGMGSQKDDYETICEVAASLGVVGVTLDGTIVAGEGSYVWDDKDIEVTHKHLQESLAKIEKQVKIDRQRIYLGGFSQGANRSAALLMTHAKEYRGAISNSPGGETVLPMKLTDGVKPPPIYFFVGKDESPVVKTTVSRLTRTWTAAGSATKSIEFEGTHQFPPEAEDQYKVALKWLLDQTK